MAEIVGGAASSHSSQVSTPADGWPLHAERDRHNPAFDFEALLASRGAELEAELGDDVWRQKVSTFEKSIDGLHECFAKANADVVLMIGDDQKELFLDENIPAFAVWGGDQAWDVPRSLDKVHPSTRLGEWAIHGDQPQAVATLPDLALHLSEALTDAAIDYSFCTRQPEGRSISHAFTFALRRIIRSYDVKAVPVFVNACYPPNQPSPERCVAFGRTLRRAIEAWPTDERVFVVTSGGLSHQLIDERLDRAVLDALAKPDFAAINALENKALSGGTGEIRNWLVMAGVLEHLTMNLLAYTPAYRTAAGTGCGMGFATWTR